MKQRSLSGIKSTGKLHIGNYFGALRQWVDLQDEYECFYFVADLHSLTSVKDSAVLKELTENAILDYLAVGLDPEKSFLYRQSDIPEVTELAWYFETLATMPYLMRAHAFKDAEAKSKDINVATFNYPMLMAADILLFNPDVVPVGKDQKQHVEIAREMARAFNNTYGEGEEIFKEPKEYIIESVETVTGIDGRKMSKSYDNVIPLFASDSELKKTVMSIVTGSEAMGDPLDPETDTVFAIYELFASEEEKEALRVQYRAGSVGYGDAKKMLLEKVIEFVTPMRERREYFANNPEEVEKIISQGTQRARAVMKNQYDLARKAVLGR